MGTVLLCDGDRQVSKQYNTYRERHDITWYFLISSLQPNCSSLLSYLYVDVLATSNQILIQSNIYCIHIFAFLKDIHILLCFKCSAVTPTVLLSLNLAFRLAQWADLGSLASLPLSSGELGNKIPAC